MAVLYRHIRLDKNEPFYIGIGKEYKRAYHQEGRNRLWKRIVDKTDYEVEVLFEDISWEEAQEKEKEFITLYGRADLGLGTLANMTDGGEGALGTTYNRGKVRSEEWKERLRNQMLGNSWNKGRVRSEEAKKSTSEKLKGIKRKPRTPEHTAKIVASFKKNREQNGK
jgi:hypothetical protein